ncbi:MAG: hypothetical protein JRG79_00360 [Deltaproteobacteria bacterium]|nr:hypothetical protein [Deltaproteobacteria bacterium]MBW1941365.1 hypothetical protein [Deltaproteobacteria bacterium]MBW2205336.1 hypothetical protein [Deltaproteobacteria bacterium]
MLDAGCSILDKEKRDPLKIPENGIFDQHPETSIPAKAGIFDQHHGLTAWNYVIF